MREEDQQMLLQNINQSQDIQEETVIILEQKLN